ncbi:hypothetical protein F5Y15DRAFT_101352 [Xylariaceae sp. FL0016]|nr:hypothetical protein F5Y15DRAFT_101352 [Xylariaceae sp. FL0016]
MAAAVDLGYLATHLGMPQANITTAVTDPTADLVKAILSAVASKAHDFDDLYSQKLQLEVELETNVRGAEAQRDASNETAKKALKDVDEIRQKLNEEETKRQTLENELQSIKSSSSTSQSEIDTLRARIASLETSNRESLAVIATKNSSNDSLSQELQAQHQKNLKLKQEIASLQQSVQNANSAVNSAKFREQSLKQQLDMAQRNADFFENETKTKSTELAKFRREKGARITELERMNDDAASNIESLKRTEQQLRQRLDEAQKKADDAWTKIQQFQEAGSRREEDLRQETDSLKRLIDLKEQQTATTKNRLHEVEMREEQIKRECEDAVRRSNEALASANLDKEELAQTIESLSTDVARLEAMGAGGSAAPPESAPQTPRLGQSMFSNRPSTPGSVRRLQNSTQILNEYYEIKGKYDAEKHRSKKLSKELDDVVDQLEAKGPELEELHAENERLQLEIKNMSHISDESFRERDVAKKAARKAENAAVNAQKELEILRKQIRELSAQVQMLIFNMQCREKGYDELSIEETLHLQQLERGQFDDTEPSDVDGMIMQRLVVFKDIQELQEKNQQLLQVTHELGQKMESEEAITAKQQAVEDHNERIRLQHELELFRDQLRAFQVQAESITKERDMFRRIVESRASADELASALGHSAPDGVLTSIEQNSTMNDAGYDYATLLRDQQQQFDQFRNEQTIDRKTMKEQNEKLSAEKNSLQAEVSKITSQLSLASERFEMLQSNFVALQTENKELQRRSQAMSESAAKQDIRTQQVAEDLVEARGLSESMRSENANLRAEKKLWKDIQDRLSQDNENLMQEKSRLNNLLATQQTLQNERELNDSEAKRRLQSQVDSLDADLSATKRKLADEVEEGKKAQLRKEYDVQQSQKRIDELSNNLSQIREELVATKITRDHLQSRVDELTIQLRSAEERTERLQPRPTPRPGSTMTPAGTDNQTDADERIEELINEVSDLKRDLELTRSQLENAQTQAERYKELSQASEEELERFNSTHEQFENEVNSQLSAKDAKIKELEQRVEDLSSELSRSNNELTSLRDSQTEVLHRFEDEKAILDEEIKRLKVEEERFTASAQFHQADLRSQASIATEAQEQYENEVMKHGETAKTLSNVRAEFNSLRTSAASWKAEAESAKATLLQSESSWDERRQRFEQELSDLRARRDDGNAQIKLLHQQLENVTSQISALQQSRASGNESLENDSSQPTGSDADNYRELNTYLRREKEILEVQYDLQTQEVRRLKQQQECLQSQLDDTRVKLEQQRMSQGSNSQNTMAHKDLMAKLEELNVFRESNTTLRTTLRQAEAQLSEKGAKIAEMESTIQPLEAQIEELQSQQSYKEAEMKQVQEDRDRWQKRTEDILSKHGRTDPAEVEELKQQVADLESERNALQAAETPLKERIGELEKILSDKETEWQSTRERLINSAKERSKLLGKQKQEVIDDKNQIQAQLDGVRSELTVAKQELEVSKKERHVMEEQNASSVRELDSLREEVKKQSAAASSAAPIAAPSDSPNTQALEDLQNQLSEARATLEDISSQKAGIETELQDARTQLQSALVERDQAISKVSSAPTNGDISMSNGGETTQVDNTAQPLSDDERKTLEDKIAVAEARAAELEAKVNELEEKQNAIVKARCDKMKEALNTRLNEYKSQMEKERAQMQQDKDKLESDFKLRIDQERKIWEAENANGTMERKPPATPQQPKPESQTPAGTPTTAVPDLNGLNDKEIRDLVFNNATIKSIVQNNIKNKLAAEAKKLREEAEAALKADWEEKINQARESATQLATSKMNLKLNLTENRTRAAQAKLGVVEEAAKSTPEKPVGEVWEVAKDAKPPPAPPKPQVSTASPGPGTPAKATNIPAQTSSVTQPGPVANNTPAQPSQPAQPAQPAQSAQANPFSSSQQGALPVNPFAQSGQQQAAGAQQPAQQSQQSQLPKASGLPIPGGNRRASGANLPRGGARGGPMNRGGRGGAQQGRNNLNPSADNFQPGNKRPRGDSEAAGNGPKRARGGGPH